MYTTVTPTLGRTLTDDQLAEFQGGSSCQLVVRRTEDGIYVGSEGDCSHVKVTITAEA